MKQRVALARSLIMDPDVLLMDEPFGAVDAQTRVVLQEELLALWERTRKTVVFVTHSIEEALYLSDRVYVLSSRPARVEAVVEVPLPRPRDHEAILQLPAYGELHRHIWSLLRRARMTVLLPLATVARRARAVGARAAGRAGARAVGAAVLRRDGGGRRRDRPAGLRRRPRRLRLALARRPRPGRPRGGPARDADGALAPAAHARRPAARARLPGPEGGADPALRALVGRRRRLADRDHLRGLPDPDRRLLLPRGARDRAGAAVVGALARHRAAAAVAARDPPRRAAADPLRRCASRSRSRSSRCSPPSC